MRHRSGIRPTLLLAAVVLAGCGDGRVLSDSRSVPAFTQVVFVTIDTLRADHLQSYGYRRQTSPFLDQLSGAGVLFSNARSTTSLTSPSHASMLTGLASTAS